MKKRKSTAIFIGFAVLLAFLYSGLIDMESKKKNLNFYNTNINGKILSVRLGKGATVLVVKNKQFIFWPNYIRNYDFADFAVKGDSVYKPAKADTLKLIHHGKIYFYTFEKI
jgi:hypothetical protein